MKARVLSGIQPTGSPHIGNYLGALKNWAKIQYDYESIYCIVDLHAITVYQDPAELRAKIEELAGMLLAIGIDPKHSSLVVQSSIPAARRTGLDADLRHAGRLAGAHDAVQGQIAGAGNHRRRPAAISGADGRRYSAVPGRHRAGGRRSVAAPGTGARHRAALQFALRRNVRHAGHAPAHGGRAHHGPRRSRKEDEQVGRRAAATRSACSIRPPRSARRSCARPRIRIPASISKRMGRRRAQPADHLPGVHGMDATRTCARTSPACATAI